VLDGLNILYNSGHHEGRPGAHDIKVPLDFAGISKENDFWAQRQGRKIHVAVL
jgi:hypothetical protein